MPQISQIDYFLTQIFWLILTFSFVYLFTANYFLPKISNIIGNRENKIKLDIEAAEKMVAQQKQLKKLTEKVLDEARSKASTMKKKIIRDSELSIQEKLSQMEKSLAKKLAQEDEKLARYKSQLEKEVPTIASKLKQEIYNVLFEADRIKFKN